MMGKEMSNYGNEMRSSMIIVMIANLASHDRRALSFAESSEFIIITFLLQSIMHDFYCSCILADVATLLLKLVSLSSYLQKVQALYMSSHLQKVLQAIYGMFKKHARSTNVCATCKYHDCFAK
jgi:hypothetical protein